MKHPIDELMQDHRVIEQVLAALEWPIAERPIAFYEKVVDFITHYADAHHHEKEEGKLFPALQAHGLPGDAGPIGCMLREHDHARAHTQRIREAIAAGDRAAAAGAGTDYAALLKDHISKEDGVLYRMALDLLPEEVFEAMEKEFEAIESAAQCQERYRALADEISRFPD